MNSLGVVAAVCLGVGGVAEEPLPWGADAQGGAPYVFQDPMDPNRLTGFEYEMAELLAQRLGRRARLVHGQWDKLLELLVRGDFDLALNGIEMAEEKKRVVSLSRPYFSAALVLTTRRGDPTAPAHLEALRGRRVGTLPGSLAMRTLERVGAAVRTYDGGQDDIYRDLRLGRLEAVLLDEPIATYYGGLDPELTTRRGDFGAVQYAIAVRHADVDLLAQVNGALTDLIRDGSLRGLFERWGLWNEETARLFGDREFAPRTEATELLRWQQAVGQLPPWWVRLYTRYPAYLLVFARGAALTMAVSLGAMALAVALGIALAVARRFGPRPLRLFAVSYIEFFRGTPLLVQLTMIYFGLPELGLQLEPFAAGVVALGLNYAAAEAENYRAGLESVPRGQLEAAQVLGLSTLQTLRLVLGPQALRVSIPPMTNDFIALLKDSSLVSVVTLTELTKSYTTLASSTRDHLGLGVLVAVSYLLLGLPFARLARWAEAWFGRHLRRSQA